MGDVQILTPELKTEIEALSQREMARLWRFAPSGHRYFITGPVHDYFAKRFKELGGMTPDISKSIGWDQ